MTTAPQRPDGRAREARDQPAAPAPAPSPSPATSPAASPATGGGAGGPGERRGGAIVGVDHVQLAMPAGDRAVRDAEAFYGGMLGLRRVPKPAVLEARGGCWFEGATVRLHLGVEEPFHPARKAHPALVVDDLEVLATRLAAAGYDVRFADEGDARTAGAYTHDPFGNRIELVEGQGPTAEVFKVVAEHAIFPLALIDGQGVIRWVGSSIERFFGWDPDDLVGQRFDHVVAPQSLPEVYEAFAAIDEAYEITPWGGVGLPVDLIHGDGHHVPCELAVVTTRRTGLPWYVLHVRRSGYERALDLAVAAMGEGAHVGTVLTQLVDALAEMVPNSVVAIGDRWSGSEFATVAGPGARLLVPEPDAPWARALRTGKDEFADRHELPGPVAALARAEGYRACWAHPVTITDDTGPTAAVVVWRRVDGRPSRFTWTTIRRVGRLLRLTLQWDRSHTTLRFAATHDPLTGLANRQAFLDRLAAVARSGEDQAAVLYLDLDHFKPVNEHLGHPVGDRVLTIVAHRLQEVLRPGDLVARIGGDEFAVLCERLATPQAVELVAARLLEVVRRPVNPLPGSNYEVCLDASIGVADVGASEPTIDTVMARADDAMRVAKTSGRGRWVRDPR